MTNARSISKEMERVFDIEIEALQAVKQSVGPSFALAVKTIAACRGRVILTGIGKSGIIANKIAATLTSTGTPALYLHATEALHGEAISASSHQKTLWWRLGRAARAAS
jgi:arabinose-5-phosphate isomerase